MCRGGKDGKQVRCKVSITQQADANLRKKIKYRADKENLPVEEWKKNHSAELTALLSNSHVPNIATFQPEFQPFTETRTLAEGIPAKIADHMKLSQDHIDSRLDPDQQKALAGYTGFAAGVVNTVLRANEVMEHTLYDKAPLWREADTAPCDFLTKEDLVDYIETMDTVLSERQEEQRVLYRGIPIYSEIQKEMSELIGKEIDVNDTAAMLEGLQEYYKPGTVHEMPTYTSTTHSAYYAADRTEEISGSSITYYDNPEIKGIQLEMKTNAGLDVTGVARHNAYEREVILPRDTRFRVESISLKPESYNTVSGYDNPRYPDDLEEGDFGNLAVVVQMVEVDKDGKEITDTAPHKPAPLNLK